MAGEIKQTIRLSGEKEYNAALKEAQRNQRTLRSELKAVTAELGSNATAQQKNEARAQSLKKQIAEQEKVVETLKKALAEAKKDYGDNEDVVQKWEQKLNAARATLADMRNGLSDAENAMRGASDATAEGVTATKSFADALGSIASVGESISGAIEGIFTDMISGVRDAITELWEFIGDAAARANNWTDIAGYWNTDPVNVQKWSRALDANGKSLADYEAIVTRLVLGGKNKEITEMLGISDVNYTDQWEYATAVMEQISELSKSGNLPENLWETIFGERRATKAMDIVNSWDSIQKDLEEFDPEKGGYGWDAEGQAALDKYYVDMERLEAKWQAIKDEVAAGLGVVTADVLVNVEGSMDALNDYFNAETEAEREAAIEKLTQNVKEAFEKVAAAIEAGLEVLSRVGDDLRKSDDPIVSMVGNILKGITDALEWLVSNQENVKHALEAVFGLWFLARLTVISGKLASIVAQIETVKAFKGLNDAGSAAAAGANAGVGAGAAKEAGAAMAGGGSAIGGALGLGAIAYGFYAAVQERLNNPNIRGSEGYMEQATGGDASLEQAFIDFVTANREWQEALNSGHINDEIADAAVERLNAAQENFMAREGHDELMDAYSAWLQENSYGNMDWVLPEGWFTDMEDAVERGVNNALGGGQDRQGGLSSDDVGVFKGLPGLLRQALFGHIGSLKVTMDGQEVGRIVTPYVSANIARDATQ